MGKNSRIEKRGKTLECPVNEKPLKKRVSVTIDEYILEEVPSKANDDDRSLSQYINLILRDYLRRNQYSK